LHDGGNPRQASFTVLRLDEMLLSNQDGKLLQDASFGPRTQRDGEGARLNGRAHP